MIFNRNRIRELEAVIESLKEQRRQFEMLYVMQVERRLRDLEVHTGLVPVNVRKDDDNG